MYERDLLDDLVAHGLTIIMEPRPAPRYRIPFHKVTSEKFKKKDQKLQAYDDIMSILAQNSVKEIAKAEDDRFLEELKKIYGTLG